MDNQHKVDEFIKLAEGSEFDDVYFEGIRFMGRPYNRIHFSYKGYNGTFDISYDLFTRVSNETIIKEILRGFKING